MSEHHLLIDSGFGNYILGGKPSAIGNAFLYDEPSILLWTDKIICDKHALEGERQFAKEGWLASQLFMRLAEKGVVVAHSFEPLLDENVKDWIRESSENDLRECKRIGRAPTSTIMPDRLFGAEHNGFLDINTSLLLSQTLGYPYLDVKQTNEYYLFKLRQVIGGQTQFPRAVVKHLIDICVPSFELCQKNDAFKEADAVTSKLFSYAEAAALGKMDEATYRQEYLNFEDAWKRYDDSVRVMALERLEIILELRRDPRLRQLRKFAGALSTAITSPTDEDELDESKIREIKIEILETQREIARTSRPAQLIDKCASYITLPIEITSMVGGLAAASFTNNPLFVGLGLLPQGMKWAARRVREGGGRRRSWYFYLLDIQSRIEREQHLHALEEKLRELNNQ